MDPEESEPRRRIREPVNLEALSEQELNAYIAELEGEIERVKGAIALRQGHRSAADQLFRRP